MMNRGKEHAQGVAETLIERIEITPENVGKVRGLVHKCREKRIGAVVLPFLSHFSESALAHELWADATDFQNEITLILGQHWKLASKAPRAPGSLRLQEYCKDGMQKAIEKAADIIAAYKDTGRQDPKMLAVIARQGRFLGDQHMAVQDYHAAITAFDDAIEQLSTTQEPENALEVYGMKAEALVRNGQVEKGILSSLATYRNYENDELGQTLKTKDKNRWVSWRAGCMIKLINALLDSDTFGTLSREEKKELVTNLHEVYKLGIAPDIKEFVTRKGQIEELFGKLYIV